MLREVVNTTRKPTRRNCLGGLEGRRNVREILTSSVNPLLVRNTTQTAVINIFKIRILLNLTL